MKCVVSGSFRKFYPEIVTVIETFEHQGIKVLSPANSRIVNPGADFVILEADQHLDIRAIEREHLAAIARADFVYLYDPDGYVGNNTAFEIGYTWAIGKPIFALEFTGNSGLDCFIQEIGWPHEVVHHNLNLRTLQRHVIQASASHRFRCDR
jgi:nucleoside 2-deoxyribosyltransferase